MTRKQQRFIEEYCIDQNATQAALRAGYSPKTAYSIGFELLKKPEIKAGIDAFIEEVSSKNVAKVQELLEYLTSVVRGRSESEIVVVEGVGEGCSSARRMTKLPDEKEKTKAAELLGKYYGMFTDKTNITGVVPVVITGSDDLE